MEYNKSENEEKKSPMYFIAIIGVILLLVALIAKYTLFTDKQSAFIKVDLLAITSVLKDEARSAGLKDGVTEAQRGLILEGLQKQMNRINPILQEEAKKCRCAILVQSAIVAEGSGMPDITQSVLNKIKSGHGSEK